MPTMALALAGSSSTTSARLLLGWTDELLCPGVAAALAIRCGGSIHHHSVHCWRFGDVAGQHAGQDDRELAAGAHGALDGNVAAELAGKTARDGKSESEALAGISFMVLNLEELVEEALPRLGLDADTGVDHVNLQAAARSALRLDAHATGLCELHRVA